MRLVISSLLIIFAVAGLFFSFNSLDYIIINGFNYYIEVASAIFISFILISILMFFMLGYSLAFIKKIPSSIQKYYKDKKSQQILLRLLSAFASLRNGELQLAKQVIHKFNPKDLDLENYELLKPVIAVLTTEYEELYYKTNKNNDDQLEDSYQKLLEYKTTQMIGLKGLISIRIEKSRYYDAMIYAKKALAISAKTDWLLKYLIEIYFELGLYKDAEETILKAENYGFLKKETAHELLISNFVIHANSCIANSNVKEAMEILEHAIKIDTANYDALVNLVRIYCQMNKTKMANKIIEKAWEKNPSVDLAKLALTINQHESLKKRINLMERFIDQATEFKAGYLVLAQLYFDNNMIDQSRTVMHNLMTIHAPDSDMSKMMALIEAKAYNIDQNIVSWINKI